MNLRTFSADASGSSVESPIISTPRERNSLFSFTSSGISRRHGPHQVAQKLITITLPKKSPSLNDAPFASFNGATATSIGNEIPADGEVATVGGGVDAGESTSSGFDVVAVAAGTKSPMW